MFKHIKTSKENKEIVTSLTNKLGLGPENIIARIAIGHSISQNKKLNINDVKNSSGKEYSYNVLLGNYDRIYIAMICELYNINKNDPDFSKYVKLHLDDGLDKLREKELKNIDQIFQEIV